MSPETTPINLAGEGVPSEVAIVRLIESPGDPLGQMRDDIEGLGMRVIWQPTQLYATLLGAGTLAGHRRAIALK